MQMNHTRWVALLKKIERASFGVPSGNRALGCRRKGTSWDFFGSFPIPSSRIFIPFYPINSEKKPANHYSRRPPVTLTPKNLSKNVHVTVTLTIVKSVMS